MAPNEMNEAPILDQLQGRWQLMVVYLLWKLSPNAPVHITAADMEACAQHYAPGHPILFPHGHSDSIELSIVTEERARQIAEHQATQRGHA